VARESHLHRKQPCPLRLTLGSLAELLGHPLLLTLSTAPSRSASPAGQDRSFGAEWWGIHVTLSQTQQSTAHLL